MPFLSNVRKKIKHINAIITSVALLTVKALCQTRNEAKKPAVGEPKREENVKPTLQRTA